MHVCISQYTYRPPCQYACTWDMGTCYLLRHVHGFLNTWPACMYTSVLWPNHSSRKASLIPWCNCCSPGTGSVTAVTVLLKVAWRGSRRSAVPPPLAEATVAAADRQSS